VYQKSTCYHCNSRCYQEGTIDRKSEGDRCNGKTDTGDFGKN